MSGVWIIVQARMRSSRLPGKVMRSLGSKTFLEHCLDRCQLFSGIDGVICATTGQPDCDVIIDVCRRRGYRWFRGSELDVLSRHYGAATEVKADAIVRITSDCPLADPEIGSNVIARYAQGGADLVTTNLPPSWPVGLDAEIFSYEVLEQATREASTRYDREHVSTFIRARPNRFRLANQPCLLEGRSHWRLTLDTEEDCQLLTVLAEQIGIPIEQARWREIFAFLDARTELLRTNTPN